MSERCPATLSRRIGSSMALALVLVGSAALPAVAQDYGNPYGEWRYWGADQRSTRYSPLDQIDASNFKNVDIVWSFTPPMHADLRVFVGRPGGGYPVSARLFETTPPPKGRMDCTV